ncbi:ABC transporter permease [Ancrocorticia sp.]|uniref:ABC transporter permease n=1 Tax=Ancrocorticia sp. TaxID=2593684 RepID=UPI003F9340B8
MKILNKLIAALIEAWGEVKVQKARVILSLVGVAAAVAAMSTVMALGDLLEQSTREMNEAWEGREVTLHISAYQEDPEGAMAGMDGMGFEDYGGCIGSGCVATSSDDDPSEAGGGTDPEVAAARGTISDPLGNAMIQVAERFEITYWSRVSMLYELPNLQFREFDEVTSMGTVNGVPVESNTLEDGWMSPQFSAVDPDYATLFRLNIQEGRWLRPGDVNQRVTPVVLNSVVCEQLGAPDIDRQPFIIHLDGDSPQQLRVVGVVKAQDPWSSIVYMPYDSWQLMQPREAGMADSSSEMVVWVGPDQADDARSILPAALSSVLGEGWQADAYGGESWASEGDQMATMRLIIMAIGGIVIFLGALGLLNVAIVTVRQRIREIGIRRAVGASAKRVFFSVFMESVVATFVAGVIGVGIAIIIMSVVPLDRLDILLQDTPAFPMSAALAGVGIATAVGALCGIIPAVAAVRVRPIDAIRY